MTLEQLGLMSYLQTTSCLLTFIYFKIVVHLSSKLLILNKFKYKKISVLILYHVTP